MGGLADGLVERRHHEAEVIVVRVPAQVRLGVVDGGAVASLLGAGVHEQRERHVRLGPAIERRGEVLLGADMVAHGGERAPAREQLRGRPLGLDDLGLRRHLVALLSAPQERRQRRDPPRAGQDHHPLAFPTFIARRRLRFDSHITYGPVRPSRRARSTLTSFWAVRRSRTSRACSRRI